MASAKMPGVQIATSIITTSVVSPGLSLPHAEIARRGHGAPANTHGVYGTPSQQQPSHLLRARCTRTSNGHEHVSRGEPVGGVQTKIDGLSALDDDTAWSGR